MATNATVETFLMILSSKLIQYDVRETRREEKRGGRGNIYRLGLLLTALEKTRTGCERYLQRDDREAMNYLRQAMLTHFASGAAGFSPVHYVEKQIDRWELSGQLPNLCK